MANLDSARFWLCVAVAMALLVPVQELSARRWARAIVNLGIIGLFLRGGLLPLLAGLVTAHLLLRALPSRRFGLPALVVAGTAVLTLFLVHKGPPSVGDVLGVPKGNLVLTTIGFSYVALRWVEIARATREDRHPPPDWPTTVNYLLPFHMLSAGPIQAYDEYIVAEACVPAALGPAGALSAVERAASGLFKKYVLANGIEALFLTDFRAGGAYFLIEMQWYYLWLFLDFSAYSDIAVGIGRLIGVATPENFDRPYLARNSIDFWERWHISLSQFIRRNLFIPIQLALVRKTGGRWPLWIASAAFTISFLLCGLWHGVSWNWLLFGAFQAAGLVTCNLYKNFLLKRLGRGGLKRYLANPWIRLVAVIVTFEFIALSLAIVNLPLG